MIGSLIDFLRIGSKKRMSRPNVSSEMFTFRESVFTSLYRALNEKPNKKKDKKTCYQD